MKKASAFFFALGLFASLALPGAEQTVMERPEVTLPVMKKAPKIDGVLQEDEWAGSVRIAGYCRLGKEELVPARAVYRLGTDGRKIYFGAVCETPKNGILRNVLPRKGNALALMDDSFEFVFSPDPQNGVKPDLYHMIINANGARYAQGQKNGEGVPWNIDPENASREENGEWSFEMAIPLESIGIKDIFSQTLGARLCRNWKRLTAEMKCPGGQSTFVNKSGPFFTSARIPLFRFRKDACAVETLQLTSEDPSSQYDLRFRIVNPTDSPITVKAVVSCKPVNSQPTYLEKTVTVAAGSSEVVSAPGPVLGDEAIVSSVNFTSPDGSIVYFRRNFIWQMNQKLTKFEDAAAKKDADRIAVKFTYLPTYNKMRIIANLSTVKEKAKLTAIRAEVRDNAGTVIASTGLSPLNDRAISDTEWTIPDLRPLTVKSGNSLYTLVVNFDGIQGSEKKLTFYRDAMDWEGNRIGKDPDIQIFPFTPITLDGMVLGTIGKKHTLLETGLWKQIDGAGKTILRDNGMRLEAVKDGKTTEVSARGFKVTKHTKTRLEAESELVSDCLKGSIRMFWEDDGMMRWKMTLTEGSADLLRLIIPFDKKIAGMMHACTDGIRFNYAGVIPEGTGVVWDGTKAPRNSIVGSYVPYIFLGNAVQGLAVFGENDKGWTQSESLPAQQIVRDEKGNIDLILNIFASPCEVKEPRTVDIGFLGTPVKPMPENWRTTDRHITGILSCLYWGCYSASDDIFPRNEDTSLWTEMVRVRREGNVDPAFKEKWLAGYQGAYPPGSEGDKRQRESWARHINAAFHVMREQHKNLDKVPNPKILIYTNARGVNFYCPSGRTYCDQWTAFETMDRDFNLLSMVAYDLDPDETYRDLAAWWYKKMFESGAIDYIYWDDTFLKSNFTLGACEAYRLPDGTIQPASGIYNQRELVRRCAAVQTEMGRDVYNRMHMTNAALAPVSSYLQTHYDWEDIKSGMDFQDRYSKECILASTAGRQMGVEVYAIGFIQAETPERMAELIRSGIGTTVTHEILWNGGGKGRKEREAIYKPLNDFGYRKDPEVRVWNYWDDDYPLAVTGGETSSIVMARGGKAMLMVNDYGNGGSFVVKPDASALGLKAGFQAFNVETGKPLLVKDGKILIELKKHDFMLIEIR